MAISPVPGGKSSSNTSRAPKCTSMMNCSRARCSMGPRHATGSLPLRNMPIEITRIKPPLTFCSPQRWAGAGTSTVGGRIRSSRRVGASVIPSRPGMEKPCTSASIMPTASPREANAAARFAVMEDLPTPPLPDTTPNTRVSEPGAVNGLERSGLSIERRAERCCGFIAPTCSCTRSIPSTVAAVSRTCCSMVFFSGQPSMVSSTVTSAQWRPGIGSPCSSSSGCTSAVSTMPSSVMGRRSSGSSTRASAA